MPYQHGTAWVVWVKQALVWGSVNNVFITTFCSAARLEGNYFFKYGSGSEKIR